MKLILMVFLIFPFAYSQNLSPEEQRVLLKEVQSLKERVKQLEKKDSGQGFKSTDYSSKTTESAILKTNSPQTMTPEQEKEIMETVEKYKKAQIEQEKALKELEDEDEE